MSSPKGNVEGFSLYGPRHLLGPWLRVEDYVWLFIEPSIILCSNTLQGLSHYRLLFKASISLISNWKVV
jgi:hypothetical protein